MCLPMVASSLPRVLTEKRRKRLPWNCHLHAVRRQALTGMYKKLAPGTVMSHPRSLPGPFTSESGFHLLNFSLQSSMSVVFVSPYGFMLTYLLFQPPGALPSFCLLQQ
jgi:nitrate reductase NapE component